MQFEGLRQAALIRHCGPDLRNLWVARTGSNENKSVIGTRVSTSIRKRLLIFEADSEGKIQRRVAASETQTQRRAAQMVLDCGGHTNLRSRIVNSVVL